MHGISTSLTLISPRGVQDAKWSNKSPRTNSQLEAWPIDDIINHPQASSLPAPDRENSLEICGIRLL